MNSAWLVIRGKYVSFLDVTFIEEYADLEIQDFKPVYYPPTKSNPVGKAFYYSSEEDLKMVEALQLSNDGVVSLEDLIYAAKELTFCVDFKIMENGRVAIFPMDLKTGQNVYQAMNSIPLYHLEPKAMKTYLEQLKIQHT